MHTIFASTSEDRLGIELADISGLASLFEAVRVNRIQSTEYHVGVLLHGVAQQFFVVGNVVVSTCGYFTFDLGQLESAALRKSAQFVDGVEIELWAKTGAYLIMELSLHQTEQVFTILKAITKDDYVIPHWHLLGDQVCPCCQKRECMVKLDTSGHPVCKILQHLYDSELELKLDTYVGASSMSLLGSISGLRFEEGNAVMMTDQHIVLPVYKIHSIQIRREDIDQQDCACMVAFNSFSNEMFKLSVRGSELMLYWRRILDDASNFHSR